jgi:hypothetical protein
MKFNVLSGIFAAAVLALVGMAIVGCGGKSERNSSSESEYTGRSRSEYGGVLPGFRDAAKAGEPFDAYGYAEYLPSTQRAAIDAFCFVADQMLKNPDGVVLEDPLLIQRITRKAESDLKSERDIVAPGPTRHAIRRLRKVLGVESLDRNLAKGYVGACY